MADLVDSDTHFVCQGCPFGCVLEVAIDADGEIVSVEGNTCKKGLAHAQSVADFARKHGITLPEANKALKEAAETESARSAEDGSGESAGSETPKPRGYRAFRREHARKRSES